MIYGTLTMIGGTSLSNLAILLLGVIFICIVNWVRTNGIDERLSKLTTYFMLLVVISFLLVGPFVMYF